MISLMPQYLSERVADDYSSLLLRRFVKDLTFAQWTPLLLDAFLTLCRP